jgi:hypothetical protein
MGLGRIMLLVEFSCETHDNLPVDDDSMISA